VISAHINYYNKRFENKRLNGLHSVVLGRGHSDVKQLRNRLAVGLVDYISPYTTNISLQFIDNMKAHVVLIALVQ
jgi:hypothetical protein